MSTAGALLGCIWNYLRCTSARGGGRRRGFRRLGEREAQEHAGGHRGFNEDPAHEATESAEREAQESADNMNQLLYNLLQWSKSQMNLLAFSPEKISLKQAIDRNVRLLQPYANLKNINIQNMNILNKE